ncbi:low choriolytic enzyme-like [Sander vitreus]
MDFRTTVSLLLLLLLGLCNAHDGIYHGADNEIIVDHSDTEDLTTILKMNNEIIVDHSDTEDLTTTILKMNNGSRDFLLEGDIVIPKTRNAMKCLDATNSCLWPKSANGNVEIPYLLSNNYDNSDRSEIQRAMKGFESNTCIRFIPRQSQKAYISLQPKYGCASLLGRTGDIQVVSLQRYGCINLGIIQHELLHVLGFYHEHTRSDRDKYIKINWDNINEDFVYNFQKQDTNNLNTPYDYSSIMHYGRSAFAKQGLDSITPIPDSSVPIGQRDGMSKIDILRINSLYQC